MESMHNAVNDQKVWPYDSTQAKKQSVWSAPLNWWYRQAAPPEAVATANFSQREHIRHGKLAALAIPIFILFQFSSIPQVITSHDPVQVIAVFLGLLICGLILSLNRKGFVKTAGALALILLYTRGTLIFFRYPEGVTLSNIYALDFTVIPDLLALAFFSANSLLLVFSLNALQVWFVMTYARHDAAIGHLLHTAPGDIYVHIYIFQFITAIALYVWARNAEKALRRADRAEEILVLERREHARRESELEQKHQLDVGIQQILQTHIAVANGDLNVRAPLQPDHALWQLAAALNNLIARLQSLSQSEHELRLQIRKDDERATNKYPAAGHTQARMASIPKVKIP